MFDGLTRDELYELHSKLADEGKQLHDRIMALPSVLSEDARVLMAKHAEISETMRAVYVEIDQRDQEAWAICRETDACCCKRCMGGVDA